MRFQALSISWGIVMGCLCICGCRSASEGNNIATHQETVSKDIQPEKPSLPQEPAGEAPGPPEKIDEIEPVPGKSNTVSDNNSTEVTLSCSSWQYPYYPEGSCGEDDQEGDCLTMPTDCTEAYIPVCGCNGKAYSNPCSAALHGTSIRNYGECE